MKYLLATLLALLAWEMALPGELQAQHYRRAVRTRRAVVRHATRPVSRTVAARVLRRSYVVLAEAHAAAKVGRVYNGALARATRHQRYARVLYRRGFFNRAIHHSRHARAQALLSLRANRPNLSGDWDRMDDIPRDLEASPSDAQLDSELRTEMPNTGYEDDEATLRRGLPDDANVPEGE